MYIMYVFFFQKTSQYVFWKIAQVQGHILCVNIWSITYNFAPEFLVPSSVYSADG